MYSCDFAICNVRKWKLLQRSFQQAVARPSGIKTRTVMFPATENRLFVTYMRGFFSKSGDQFEKIHDQIDKFASHFSRKAVGLLIGPNTFELAPKIFACWAAGAWRAANNCTLAWSNNNISLWKVNNNHPNFMQCMVKSRHPVIVIFEALLLLDCTAGQAIVWILATTFFQWWLEKCITIWNPTQFFPQPVINSILQIWMLRASPTSLPGWKIPCFTNAALAPNYAPTTVTMHRAHSQHSCCMNFATQQLPVSTDLVKVDNCSTPRRQEDGTAAFPRPWLLSSWPILVFIRLEFKTHDLGCIWTTILLHSIFPETEILSFIELYWSLKNAIKWK